MSSARTLSLLFSLALLVPLVGCGNEIGDACETALDCSSQGSRLCDRTQPHGYCTLRGCEQGTCPEESVCVKFRPEQERLAVTYCMYGCEEDDDCRNDEGYQCMSASELGGRSEARILGDQSQRFCVAKPRTPVDAGVMMSLPEPEPNQSTDSSAGSNDAGAADAASTVDASDGAIARDAASSSDSG
jgi:hypothetical protein